MNFYLGITIKLILSILFLLCLADMPYGYYELVRIVGLIGFSLLAYQASQKENKTEMIIYIGLALLFQPFLKIALGRELWNVVDVVVTIGLIVSMFIKTENKA